MTPASQASSRWLKPRPGARPEEAAERAHLRLVARAGQEFLEGQGEEHVAGLDFRGVAAFGRVDGGTTAAQLGVVEYVVVDERRHVHEFDRGTRADQRRRLLVGRVVDRAASEDEQRTQPLAAGAKCRERGAGRARVAGFDDLGETGLDVGQPGDYLDSRPSPREPGTCACVAAHRRAFS